MSGAVGQTLVVLRSGFAARFALVAGAGLCIAIVAGCGGRAERVTGLDVRCESVPAGEISGQPGEIAAGTDIIEASLQLDDGQWVATWKLAGDHTDVASFAEASGWTIGLLAPDEEGAYAIEVRQDDSGLRGSVAGGGPSLNSADRDAVTASADGDVVTARLPLEAMSEVEVDWGWNAQSFSGDPLAGGLHTDRCFANSTTEPLKASGTVTPSS